MKKQPLYKEIIYTFSSLVKGLAVTFVNLFRKKVTLMYPEERWPLPDNYRGLPVLPVDPATGKVRCIACGACARVCPEQIITIQHEIGEDKKRKLVEFTIDASRCMFCGLCVESCPTKGLVTSKLYELSSFDRDQMIFNLKALSELGGTFHEEPEPDSECQEKDNPSTEGAAEE